MIANSSPGWERAAHRAAVRNISARLVEELRTGQNGSTFFDVGSFSTPGLLHRVRIDATAAGVDVRCDCEGNLNGRICQHMAAALDAWERSTEPEPISTFVEPQPQPQPEPLPRLLQRFAEEA